MTEKEHQEIVNLANKYGKEMELYGKSLYWNSPRECPNTTNELMENELFVSLPNSIQNSILEYGQLRKLYGMGCYQERGYAAEVYDKYFINDGPEFKI